jgi:hypothetical protein
MSIPTPNPLGAPTLTNYGGKVPDPTSSIKQFYTSDSNLITWVYKNNGIGKPILTPTVQSSTLNVVIPGDLTVKGTISTPSDIHLKEYVYEIPEETFENVLELQPKSFCFKEDTNKKTHFGFIAQEVEELFPELVSEHNHTKHVNYLEFIPLLLGKMRQMQEEINELRDRIDHF